MIDTGFLNDIYKCICFFVFCINIKKRLPRARLIGPWFGFVARRVAKFAHIYFIMYSAQMSTSRCDKFWPVKTKDIKDKKKFKMIKNFVTKKMDKIFKITILQRFLLRIKVVEQILLFVCIYRACAFVRKFIKFLEFANLRKKISPKTSSFVQRFIKHHPEKIAFWTILPVTA